MDKYQITLNWKRITPDFKYETYDRTHTITFDGGSQIQASAAPAHFGNPKLPNPEKMLIAAVSSCYMLTFLAVAGKQGFVVDSYNDKALGIMGKNDKGQTVVTEVILKPEIKYSGKQPDAETLRKIHEKSHTHCFITNSVTAQVKVENP
jgi:organic hydroperoxide reductase OsmC/OhrA